MDAAPAQGWLDRLRAVLARCGLQVVRAVAGRDAIEFTLGPGDGRELHVTATRRAGGAPAYRTGPTLAYAYAADPPPTPAEMAEIDLLVSVMTRLEARLPAEWRGAAAEAPDDVAFHARYPFARVERSVTAEGAPWVEVLLRLTARCNQDCPFCSAPPTPEPGDGEVEACVADALRTWPSARLILTGGEPALSSRLDAAIRTAIESGGTGGIVVQTNAVPFAVPGRAAALPADPRVEWFMSLHAADDDTYDLCTGTRGQLPRALAGLRALVATGRRVTVNVVVGSRNLFGLDALVDAVARAARGVPSSPTLPADAAPPTLHFSAMMCPEGRPSAADWLVPYRDLVPALIAAEARATAAGLPVDPLASSTHASAPPCVLPPGERAVATRRPEPGPGETGYEDLSRPWVKASTCRACAFDAHCLGVPAPYARRFGVGELVPVGPAGPARPAAVPAAVTCPATRGRMPAILALAARLAAGEPGLRLTLDVPDPGDSGPALPGDEPLPASAVTREAHPLLRRAFGVGVTVRSRAGRPLCLFDDTLAQVVLGRGGTSDPPPRDAAYGPACAGCALRPACGGVSAGYLVAHGGARGDADLRPFPGPPLADPAAASWQDKARLLLFDRPGATVALRDLLPAGAVPDLACTLPWTRLELHEGRGGFGPCCSDWMARRSPPGRRSLSPALWNHATFQAFREAMLRDGARPATCRPECPVLASGRARAADLLLRGGPAARVGNQVALVDALLAGRTRLDARPLSVCFPVTSGCNHDCVMCDCGERGTLADQRRPAFYASLEGWLDAVVEVDANGGEPFLSRPFRAFVERLARRGDGPGVQRGGEPVLSVVTNGSLLTPAWLGRLATGGALPFRGLVVSLNAATPETYLAVNRGVPWAAVRRNLDALLALRASGRLAGGLAYSMVLQRMNANEIERFANLAIADGVDCRFMLPVGDRGGQSVLTDRAAALAAAASVRRAAAALSAAGNVRCASDALAVAGVIEDRVARGVLSPL
ncbi:MAG: radical SAM protein [Deltaproteobacteria bacterium]|nr:radical SAM protein [Deltaproteobacteria bacterium]